MSILPNKHLQTHAALVELVESSRQLRHAVRQVTHTVGATPKLVFLPDDEVEFRWEDCDQAWQVLVELGGKVHGDRVVLALPVDGATAIATRRPGAGERSGHRYNLHQGPGLLVHEPDWT